MSNPPVPKVSSAIVQQQFVDPKTGIPTRAGQLLLSGAAQATNAVAEGDLSNITIPLGPLTGGGTAGSITFANGILTGWVNPT